MQELTIIRPDDFHVHLRDIHYALKDVLPFTARVFGRALAMPNLMKPILTAEDATFYREAIVRLAKQNGYGHFTPLMTIQIVDATTPETVRAAHEAGVTAGKLYPAGVTTNSANGVQHLDALAPVFKEMERLGMVLCLHGETPGAFSLDREERFLETLSGLVRSFPRLRMVLEHLSTAAAVRAVRSLPDTVGATITAHHLTLTLDDVIGDKLRPDHFCKPVPKRPEDRDALLEAAMSDDPKFFFGSDSAPHSHYSKYCAEGCAGVFSAPVALSLLAEVFERHGALARLENFVSMHGACFYGLPLNDGFVRLVKRPCEAPSLVGNSTIPFMAGKTLGWSVAPL